jgi:hypothetical protein
MTFCIALLGTFHYSSNHTKLIEIYKTVHVLDIVNFTAFCPCAADELFCRIVLKAENIQLHKH